MCKFENNRAPGYRTVAAALKVKSGGFFSDSSSMVTGKGHVERTKVHGSFGVDEGIAIEDVYGETVLILMGVKVAGSETLIPRCSLHILLVDL